MPRTRQAVAQRVADHLFALEEAIDVAITRAAELNASMPAARGEARLPAMIGQTALDRAAETFSSLVQARRNVVETHHSLDEARAQIGLQEVSIGDMAPKPPAADIPYGRVAPVPLRAVS
ncbi:MAG TPA: hypothetical protein VLK25_03525 [Allosphingosinicella sp.]|nr:hypothetical protein [Allosphingosinicella sp.]